MNYSSVLLIVTIYLNLVANMIFPIALLPLYDYHTFYTMLVS